MPEPRPRATTSLATRLVITLGLAIAVLTSLAACSSVDIGPGADRVHLENDTDFAVGVYLNDEWAGTYPAGAAATVALRGHRGPPFAVSIRTALGESLLEEAISAVDMRRAREEGFGWSSAASQPCGSIRLTFGDVPVVDDVPDGPCP